MHSIKDKPEEDILSCSILPDDTVFVATKRAFNFYDSALELLTEVGTNSIIDGLARDVALFKPQTHTQDTEYVLVTKVDDIGKIKARGTNSYNGKGDINIFMIELIVKNGQL